jgi:hypothetical protein
MFLFLEFELVRASWAFARYLIAGEFNCLVQLGNSLLQFVAPAR